MSTPLPTFATDVANSPRPTLSIAALLREPLLHFIVLGAVLFLIDYVAIGQAADPRSITIGVEVDDEARQIFKASRGRDPNADELKALRQVWLDNEVLYREGIQLQVDKGDSAIRERVIFKALSIVDANVKLPIIDAEGLREWFTNHRDKYDEPARFDFQEAALAGNSSSGEVRSFVNELNAGAPGDAKAGLRVFKGRPLSNLVQSYGDQFAKSLEESTPGKWYALETRDGWRAVRVDAVTPAKPAVFEIVSGIVLQDWKDAIAAEQRTAAVRALAKKYVVTIDAEAR